MKNRINIAVTSKDGLIREVFSTNAPLEVIKHIIAANDNRYDMLRKWDAKRIKKDISWVSYHIRRSGYVVGRKIKNSHNLLFKVSKISEWDKSYTRERTIIDPTKEIHSDFSKQYINLTIKPSTLYA